MKHSHSRFSLLPAALLSLASLTGNAALPPLSTAPITFNPQGAGGGLTVGAFDWAVNSTLDVDILTPGLNSPVQNLLHTALQGYNNPAGDPRTINDLNNTFEITVVYGSGINVLQPAQTLLFTLYPFPDDPDPLPFDNFFRMYYDDTPDSSALTGAGYTDGKLILEGSIVDASGEFNPDAQSLERLDAFGADDWGTSTVTGRGAHQIRVLVTDSDPDFFPDLGASSIIPFSTERVLNFLEVNPSFNMDTATGSVASNVGSVNAQSGPDILHQVDPNNAFTPLEITTGCRVTGGGNDTSGILETGGHDGTEASGETFIVKRNGRIVVDNRYTFGGQAGANTALQPQPKGELSHTNHQGSSGQWTFHAGTASAPPGTEVDEIICSDEGWCRQARPAPTKQIDFTGIGSFRNLKKIGNLDAPTCPSDVSDGTAPGRSAAPPKTYHWFEVHIEDLGEPGREGQHTVSDCPAAGSGTDAFDNVFGPPVFALANCDCPDYYRLRIYCGVVPDDVDGNGKADLDSDGNVTNFAAIKAEKYNQPIYEVGGYINGGNWQIHPLTGFDLKNF